MFSCKNTIFYDTLSLGKNAKRKKNWVRKMNFYNTDLFGTIEKKREKILYSHAISKLIHFENSTPQWFFKKVTNQNKIQML